VCVNSLLAQLEALLPSFLPSFQGLVIFIKDLLTHIEFDHFVLKKKRIAQFEAKLFQG